MSTRDEKRELVSAIRVTNGPLDARTEKERDWYYRSIVVDVIYVILDVYRDLGKDQQGVQDRIGCLFFICLNVAYTSALPAINLFAGEKSVIGRERSSGAYSCSAYYISKYMLNCENCCEVVLLALVYNVVGFREGAEYFWTFVSIIICEALAAQALGIFMAAALPVGAALALGPADYYFHLVWRHLFERRFYLRCADG